MTERDAPSADVVRLVDALPTAKETFIRAMWSGDGDADSTRDAFYAARAALLDAFAAAIRRPEPSADVVELVDAAIEAASSTSSYATVGKATLKHYQRSKAARAALLDALAVKDREIERLTKERDESRSDAERFRQSMYAVEWRNLANLARAEKAEAELARLAPDTNPVLHSCPCGLGAEPCPGPDGRPLCALSTAPAPAYHIKQYAGDLSNHHNALLCQYCNPENLRFALSASADAVKLVNDYGRSEYRAGNLNGRQEPYDDVRREEATAAVTCAALLEAFAAKDAKIERLKKEGHERTKEYHERAIVAREQINRLTAALAASQDTDALREALQQMVDEKVDYMLINNLGDPEKQHTIKLARAALSIAPAPERRDDRSYAIEHAEYMAKGAERLLDAINALAKGEGAADDDATLDAAQNDVSEGCSALRSLVYEFRKRALRAEAAKLPEAK